MTTCEWRNRPCTFTRLLVAGATGCGTLSGYARVNCPLYPCPTTFVGTGTYTSTIGDINGDSIPDVVLGRSNATVGIFLNDGGGHFTSGATYPVQSQPRTLAVVDVDQDGDNDIISVNRESGSISTLLNDGAGVFGDPEHSLCGPQPTAVDLADVDGDGDLDAAIANAVISGTVTLLSYAGNGAFTTLATVPVGNTPGSVALGKLNNDVHADVVVTYRNGSNGRLAILYNRGDGVPGTPIIALDAIGELPAVRIGDLDNDADQDIVAVGRSIPNYRLINDGFGGFKVASSATGSVGSEITALNDVNSDDLPDLLTVQASGPGTRAIVESLTAPGATFEPQRLFWGAHDPNSISVGPLDADEHPDLLLGSFGQFTFLFGDGRGNMLGETRVFNDFAIAKLISNDLDRDGIMDIIAGGGGAPFSTLRNNGALSFGPPVLYSFGSSTMFGDMTVADMNGDGDGDMVYLSRNGRLYVLLNTGGGIFGPAAETMVSDGNGRVACADFDADGNEDVVISNPEPDQAGDTFTLLLNDGAGSFGTPTFINCGTTPNTIIPGDMDLDGDHDIVLANLGYFNGTASISVFRNDGVGGFSPPLTTGLDGRPGSAAVADLDDDGNLDAVAAMSLTLGGGLDQRVAILMNAGDGTLQSPTYIVVTVIPNRIVIGDVNADGRADIIACGQNSSGACILINRGDSTFEIAHHSTVGSPNSLVLEDFTGDDHPDIMIAHQADNFLGLLEHQGFFTTITQQPLSLSVQPGDDATFTVVANPSTGLDYQWLRNGVPLIDGGHVSGATTSTLLISQVSEADAGEYRARISQSPCSLETLPADLVVLLDCPADISPGAGGNGLVDIDDLLAVISAWGPCPTPPALCPANIVNSGASANVVDIDDLLAVISAWGPCP